MWRANLVEPVASGPSSARTMPVVASAPSRAAIPISVSTLIPKSVPGVSLYVADSAHSFRLYRDAEHPITEADLENLRKRGVSKLYVAWDEHDKYQAYLRDNLDAVLDDESIPADKRLGCLNEVVRDVLGDVLQTGDLDSRIDELKGFGEKTVETICRYDVVLSQLRGVLVHDYHTFMHSANVSFYSVMLARAAGIEDRAELSSIATGGLIHDAGKLDVPVSILAKPGPLDDKELQIMRRHPTLGFRALCNRDDLSLGQLMMVYQHHEQMDGKGYPVGSTASEFHPWARICAVADVFEALTSNRPYRAALPFTTACQMMAERATAFDPDLLKCWTECVSRT